MEKEYYIPIPKALVNLSTDILNKCNPTISKKENKYIVTVWVYPRNAKLDQSNSPWSECGVSPKCSCVGGLVLSVAFRSEALWEVLRSLETLSLERIKVALRRL
jgi:hypothetical protein